MVIKAYRTVNIIFDDEELQGSLDKLISGLLPHGDNYQEELAYRLVRELEKIIDLGEMEHVYHILFKAIKNKFTIKSLVKTASGALSEDELIAALEVQIFEMVKDDAVNVKGLLDTMGKETDLEVESNFNEAVDVLYSLTIDKYRELFNMQYPTEKSFTELTVLMNIIKQNLYQQAINMQAQILTDRLQVGKKVYQGSKDMQEFISRAYPEIESRFVAFLKTKTESASFTSTEESEDFDKDTQGTIEKLYDFGYEPLDTVPMETKTLLTVVGDEGVGKTQFMVDQAWKCMKAGHDVLVMTGESELTKIRHMIIAREMKHTHRKRVNWKEIQSPNEDFPDELLDLAKMVKAEMINNDDFGKLHLVQEFSYETFYEEVEAFLVSNPNIKMVFVDHTDQLGSTGGFTEEGRLSNQRERVGYLYKQSKKLKREYNIALLFLAHSSTDAAKASTKGKEETAGTRIGANSSATSKDSDMVFHLTKGQNEAFQGLIKVRIAKMREYSNVVRPFLLKMDGVCSEFSYDDKYQAGLGEVDTDVSQLY